ncbi:MAG: flagellar hook-associated protein FlgK [Proteobacteria bacterium]|nr:flagellar hook-associated protein FlgK [Pseudomonadota bacterium]
MAASSISVTLSTALSGLMANQASLSVTANNIANATTEGYTQKTANRESRLIDGQGAGVQTTSITRKVNEFLLKDLRAQLSLLGKITVQEQFYNNMENLFGQPDSNSSVAATLTNLGNVLEALAVSPDSSNTQINVINAALDLTRQINDMAKTSQDLRNEANIAIAAEVKEINTLLANIAELNSSIARNKALGFDYGDLADQRDISIAELAEKIDITYFIRDNGKIVVFSASGRTLVDITPSTFAYTPASSMSSTTSYPNNGIDDITLDGNDITTDITGGKLKALIDLRDTTLPDLNIQFNTLAAVVRDQLNAIHNDGAAYPPPNALTGTRTFAVPANDMVTLSGIVRISVVDANGKSVGVPMDLDLADLTTLAAGANPTVNEVRDAINGVYSGSVPAIPGLTGATASVNSSGQLVITADNSANGIAINERTSAEATTGFGFSHYFGLNDLFTGDSATGLASNIAVRSDIVANPQLLARGELSEATLVDGTTAVTVGDNTVAQRLANKFNERLSFAASGGIPQTTTTLSGYGATILSTNANLAANITDDLRFRKIVYQQVLNKTQSASGVNVDEELANLILFQNAYAASARMVTVISEVMKILVEMGR